jgi:lysophospholipase L1-like esterase
VLVLVLILAACGGGTDSSAGGRRAPRATLVALGDSVPAGTACDCKPYPELTGTGLSRSIHERVRTLNDAVPGATSGDVVAQLQDDANVIAEVRGSEAVMVEIGANDVAFSATCGTTVSCYEQQFPQLRTNLVATVDRVRALNRGRHLAIVLLDYWSVWLGGQYATAQGPAYVDAADAVTQGVNGVIRSTARSTGSTYVDVLHAFRGPNERWDETHLLAADGEHPNAAGHRRIAEAVRRTVS